MQRDHHSSQKNASIRQQTPAARGQINSAYSHNINEHFRQHSILGNQAIVDRNRVGSEGYELPHYDKIQASFGSHDVSQVQAYTGTRAAATSREIGAQAYALGNVLHVAPEQEEHLPHEAWHTQRQTFKPDRDAMARLRASLEET